MVNTPSNTGADSTKDIVTMENLWEKILELENRNILSRAQTAEIDLILRNGTDIQKEKLLEISKKLYSDEIERGEFLSRLLEITKMGNTQTTPEQQKQSAEDLNQIQSMFGKEISNMIFATSKAIESIKIQKQPSPEINRKLEKINKELLKIKDEYEKANTPIMEMLAELRKKNVITKSEGEEIMDLMLEAKDDQGNPHFEKKWEELTKNIAEKSEDPEVMAKLLLNKKLEAQTFSEVSKRAEALFGELNGVLNQAREYLMQEVQRQNALKFASRELGIPLEKGKEIRFKDERPVQDEKGNLKKDAKGNYLREPIYRRMTILDVSFGEIETQTADGKTVKTPDTTPTVKVEIVDEWPDKQGRIQKIEETTTPAELKKRIDYLEMSEFIADRQDTLETDLEISEMEILTGFPVKIGDTFEYREYTNNVHDKLEGHDKTVKVLDIRKQKVEFFNKPESQRKDVGETVIELDKEVVTGTYPKMVTKKVLTLGEFAKWKNRMEAQKPITLKEARKELLLEAESRNKKYQRKPEQFPPILLEPHEQLYYDIEPPKSFKIATVEDDAITLANGAKYTPATFINWVKRNEVEKKTTETEATTEPPTETEPPSDTEAPPETPTEPPLDTEPPPDEPPTPNPTNPEMDNSEETTIPPSSSYLRTLWTNTHFFSLADMYEMGKVLWDFYTKTRDRRIKNKVGVVGEKIFGSLYDPLGAEFKTIKQNSENERVNYYKEAYSNFGVVELYQRLSTTTNKDELKALFITLASKGAIRWESKLLWDAINRVVQRAGGAGYITNYDEDQIAKTLDGWWGEQSFNDWKNQNNNAYGNTKNSFKQEANRLENDPQKKGGLQGHLQHLLLKHRNGEYVDPAVYEGYLHAAIEMGRLTFEGKIYFLFMGLGLKDQGIAGYSGKPLLTFSRISEIEGGLLNNFPIIDYFTSEKVPMYDNSGNPILDAKGNPVKGKMDKNYVAHIIDKYLRYEDLNKASEFSPGEPFVRFVQREMMAGPTVYKRIEKASMNMSRWDHDDFQMFAPHLGERAIENLTSGLGPAAQGSTEAVRNALVGFNHFSNIYIDEFTSNAGKNTEKADFNMAKMVKGLSSYVRLSAILDDRFHHGVHDRNRKSKSELNEFAGSDSSRTVLTHMGEIDQFLGMLFEKMNNEFESRGVSPNPFSKLHNNWNVNKIYLEHFGSTERNKQLEQADALRTFGTDFGTAMSKASEVMSQGEIASIISGIQGTGGKDGLVKGILNRPVSKEQIETGAQKNKDADNTISLKNIGGNNPSSGNP